MTNETVVSVEVERMCRALCEADGYDPDQLEPGDDPYHEEDGFPSPCIDGYNRKDEPCHFVWRRYDKSARAAIGAARPSQPPVMDVETIAYHCSMARNYISQPAEQTPDKHMVSARWHLDKVIAAMQSNGEG